MIDPQTPGGVAGIGAGLIALAFAIRKIVTSWQSEVTQHARLSAEQSILSGMTNEITRLQTLTRDLSSRIAEMHAETVELHRQISALRIENADLQEKIELQTRQNERLTTEITRLHHEVSRLKGSEDE